MMRSPLRAGIALACALSLSACGGGKGDVYLGGTITGYTGSGLVLTNNDGARFEVPANATSFVFPNLVETDSGYNVKVVESPANTKPTTPGGTDGCKVVEGTGSGRAVFNINSVRIVCTPKTYPLTVNVTGNRVPNLEVVNGADRQPVPAGSAPATVQMREIPAGTVYGVTVLPLPGQTCTVTNGSGTMDTVGKTVDLNCTTP